MVGMPPPPSGSIGSTASTASVLGGCEEDKMRQVTIRFEGRTGSGKTCLARWVAEMLEARGVKVERLKEPDKVIVELIHPWELTMESMEALRRARR